MPERNETNQTDTGEERPIAPREQSEGPAKQHGDGLLEGTGSRHGADAADDEAD